MLLKNIRKILEMDQDARIINKIFKTNENAYKSF
jgi:hypothetical protein